MTLSCKFRSQGHLTAPWGERGDTVSSLAPGGGKMRDPGNEGVCPLHVLSFHLPAVPCLPTWPGFPRLPLRPGLPGAPRIQIWGKRKQITKWLWSRWEKSRNLYTIKRLHERLRKIIVDNCYGKPRHSQSNPIELKPWTEFDWAWQKYLALWTLNFLVKLGLKTNNKFFEDEVSPG